MTNIESILRRLAVVDIFHGNNSPASSASLICLVTAVIEDTIEARTVTHQQFFKFNRRTGIGIWEENATQCIIDSIAPLPVDIHNVMLGIDRKFRLELDIERLKLTEAEKQGFLFVASHYRMNPLQS